MKFGVYDENKGEKVKQNIEAYENGEIVRSYFCGKGVSTIIYIEVMNRKYSLIASNDLIPKDK